MENLPSVFSSLNFCADDTTLFVTVREGELQEMVNQANKKVDQDKEKFHQLEVIIHDRFHVITKKSSII